MRESNNSIRICRASRRTLQVCLLWPDPDHELNPGNKFKWRIFCFYVICSIPTLLVTIHVGLVFTGNEPFNPEDIALLIAGYGSIYMASAYLRNRQEIAFLLRDLSNFQRFGKPPGFDELDKRLNFYTSFFNVYVFMTILLYALVQFLDKENCKKTLEKLGSKGTYCGLIAPAWIPSQLDCPPVFYLLEIYLLVGVQIVLKLPLNISLNALEIGQHIVLRLNHLKGLIATCFDPEDDKLQRARFKQCISYHSEVLNFAARLHDAFFNSMFGHFLLTGAICACLEKQIADGINVIPGILHFIGWIMALFVGCFGGQLFLNANEIVPTALWFSKWYKADVTTQKDVVFMLARTQKIFFISAGPFGVLSFPLFVSVIKTSYSIFCLLTS